jgi:hypothetical protein
MGIKIYSFRRSLGGVVATVGVDGGGTGEVYLLRIGR